MRDTPTESLRPCGHCDRHVSTDETICPFCGATLPLLHRRPVIPSGAYRPAPKYGGPPWVRPGILASVVIFVQGIVLAVWYWLSRE